MNIEFISYLSLIILSFFVIIDKKKFVFFSIYLFFLIVFIISNRLSNPAVDIVTYAEYMNYFSLFMLKEFVFYSILYFVNYLLQDSTYTFIILDIFFIILLITALLKTIKNGEKLFVIIFLSFPFFIGIENIYRQWVAMIFFIISYLYSDKSIKKSYIYFFLSIFSHNSFVLFLPLLLISISKKRYFKLVKILLIFYILFVFLIFFGIVKNPKSDISSGVDLSFLYSIIFITLFIFLLKVFSFKLNKLIIYFPSIYFSVWIITPLLLLNTSSQIERLGLVFLLLISIDIFKYSKIYYMFNTNSLINLYLLCILTIPILLFTSTRNFLF